MFVQIVKFKLKPGTSRDSFLAFAEQMMSWLKSQNGFIAYELYEGAESWSDRIAWKNQECAHDGLNGFLATTTAKEILPLIEDGHSSFFGHAVIASHHQ